MPAQQASKPAAEMCYSGMKMAKPPLKHLHFDVTLHNAAAGPRWFIFPASFYEKPAAPLNNAGIFAMEVLADPENKVIVASLLGTYRTQPDSAGGVKALLLPAGAVVTVRDFSLSFWGDDPSHFSIHLQIAQKLEIAGISLEQWIGRKFMSASAADVRELDIVAGKRTPDNNELPVEVTQSSEFVIEKPLAHRCPEH